MQSPIFTSQKLMKYMIALIIRVVERTDKRALNCKKTQFFLLNITTIIFGAKFRQTYKLLNLRQRKNRYNEISRDTDTHYVQIEFYKNYKQCELTELIFYLKHRDLSTQRNMKQALPKTLYKNIFGTLSLSNQRMHKLARHIMNERRDKRFT